MTDIVLSYENTCLTVNDLVLLDDGRWLNDKVIGFVFEYFEVEKFSVLKDSICLVSPEVTQFVKFADDTEVSIFLEPLNLKTKDLVFFALNNNMSDSIAGGSHWSLLVYERKISIYHHFDSLNQSNESISRMFINKVNKFMGHKGYTFKPHLDCKQQVNSFDCGVFVICYAESICYSYIQSQDVIKTPVEVSNVETKRTELKELINSKRN